MSQQKVDQYKKEKAGRKEAVAKQKRNKKFVKIGFGIVGIVLAGWIAISTVDFVKDSRPVDTIYAKTTALDDYLNDLYADDTEE